jgi:hypothetical protein
MQAGAPVEDISRDRLIARFIYLANKLEVDRTDFVIFGSGPLLAHGLRRRINDLDVVARGQAWRTFCDHGVAGIAAINRAPLSLFWDGLIQVSEGWISEDWDADGLIDRAEIIQGLPFARLADVLGYKQVLQRPKDRIDIELLLNSR